MSKIIKDYKKEHYNVLDYGALADGITLDSYAVQKAVDECAIAGGGVVYFPFGTYVLSTIFLKSNIHLLFEDGVKILGSLDFNDYAVEEKIDYPIYQDASHTYFDSSMFVGRNCENIKISGNCFIDMRSVWDENCRKPGPKKYRGAKCIALKECNNVEICDLRIENATDLAIYFAGCENVDIYNIKMRVHIDGISPDCSKNVRIYDCDVESGDDAIVLKTSYTLNRIEKCENIKVWNCQVKSRCNAIKIGTETNGGFENIEISDIQIRDTRVSGIAIESVDGAIISGIIIKNIVMQNVNAPIFIHLGKRLRGPEGCEIGEISNIILEDIEVKGPYVPYSIIPHYYVAYKENDNYQYPWLFVPGVEIDEERKINGENMPWQISSNVCGLKGKPLKNITLKNINLMLDGGVSDYKKEVPENAPEYPNPFGYGVFLPAKGLYFRYVENLLLDNVTVTTYKPDVRKDFVFESVTGNVERFL